MPEGDTIYQAATNLRKVLDGRTISFAAGRQELRAETVVGHDVNAVEARGKHLLLHFSNQTVLHSHMGMTGSWHIYRKNDAWQKPRPQAFIQLHADNWVVVCFTPKMLRLVTKRELSRDPYLQKLGPDILGPPIDDSVFLSRIRTQNRSSIGEAVINQTIVCGIGNIFKSEVLFLEGIHPEIPVGDINDEVLLRIRDRAASLMKRNLNNGPRKTRFGAADEQKLWVYGRQSDHCLRCGQTVAMVRQGDTARSTYFCPECQPR